MDSVSKVYFFFEKSGFALKKRGVLKQFIAELFKKERKALESINYIFCSDKKLLAINKTYLQHDFYTDIISFDLSSGPQKRAEVYISVDRVRDNAKTFGSSFNQELHRVIFHGALHLCGYNDKSNKERISMQKKEDQYLSLYGIVPRGTPRR